VLDRARKMVEGMGGLVEIEHVEPEEAMTGQLSASWRRSSMRIFFGPFLNKN
jgi:hypothetical protein